MKYPKEEWIYELQQEPDALHVYCDSDWAACAKTRKSVRSYAIKYGSHLLETSSPNQSVVALSSGEAEYYSLTRGASAGLLVKGVYEEMRKSVQLSCLTDSSAAKGITARKGVGKVKHLSLRELWLQDAVQEKRLKVYKVHTDVNWADLGTKILAGTRVLQLLRLLPLKRGAIIASMMTVGSCQPEEKDEENSGYFWMYLLIVHLFALFGIVSLILRLCKSQRPCNVTTSKGKQTDPEVRALREPNESAPAVKAAISRLDTGLRLRTTAAATPSAASSNEELVCVIGHGERYHR